MKYARFLRLFPCLMATFLLSQTNPVSPTGGADPKAQARILEQYGKLPLSFEANHGQVDSRVKFLSRTGGYSLFLTADEAVMALRGKAKTPSPKGASHSGALPVSLKRYPDTNPKQSLDTDSKQNPDTKPRHNPDKSSVATASETVTGGVLRMKLRDANPAAAITGVDELAGTSNYFIGNDPSKWQTGVPTYAKVKYEGIYSGIDLVYYGNEHQLEYDFIVTPGADPRRIAFDVRGARRILRDAHGELVFTMAGGEEVRWHRPVVYQKKDGAREMVAARYVVAPGNRVRFAVGKYDARRALYIDPVVNALIYSSYLGGSGQDAGLGIAVDSAGDAYIAGWTCSTDFPTMNPLQPGNAGGNPYCGDAFVTKINATGSALMYSTYLGGSGDDQARGIAVDSAGNAYVAGFTSSTDFPTITPFQSAYGGGPSDAFVAKLNPAGSVLVYSTYLGGSGDDEGYGIAVDGSGSAYVVGETDSAGGFPTMNPLQPTYGGGSYDAFLAKLSPAGSSLAYSTYMGGSGYDEGFSIAVDSSGNAYFTGVTGSTDFPTKNPLQASNAGGVNGLDAFVTKINSGGSALVYSTYLGGSSDDYGYGIAADNEGNAYVTGQTASPDFPTKSPLQSALNGGLDAFVSKINAAGSAFVYSTYLGGSRGDTGFGIASDNLGDAYITGITGSPDFPTTPGALKRVCKKCAAEYGQAFISKINPTGSALFYSTYLGGSGHDLGQWIAVGPSRNAYVSGLTESTDFPTRNPFQPTYAGGGDAFVAEIDVNAVTTTTLSSSPNPSTYGEAVTFTAVITSTAGAPPDGESVSFMKGKTVLGTGTLSGGSASFTTSTLKVGTTSVKAVYGGDSNFAASTSKAVKQVVN